MSATQIVHAMRRMTIAQREDFLLQAVKDGNYVPPQWCPIEVTAGIHGTIFVATDAFRVGSPDDSVRINVSPRLAQRIADHIGHLLPTTHVCDLVERNAVVRIAPQIQPADALERREKGYSASMSDVEAMIRHHRDIEKARAGRCGLLCNVGKHWVLTNGYSRHDSPANYGWYDSSAPYRSASGYKMWQTLGYRHNTRHVDYSQVLRLVKDTLIVDGREMSTREALAHPDYSALLSSEGPLKFLRIPAVPTTAPTGDDRTTFLPIEDRQPPKEQLSFRRLLRLESPHMVGDDVGQWQRFVGVGSDNVFGPITHNATRQWQRAHGLDDDGVVGPKTVAKANEIQGERDDLIDDFVQARNYSAVDRSAYIKHIVIHTMETPEKPTAAEAVAAWFAGPHAPKASAHFCVDSDSIVQCVRVEHIAWHAPGCNKTGIGIEHPGFAKQTADEWADDYSIVALDKSSRLAARLCRKHGLPVVFVDAEGLKAGRPGITTHNEVSKAFKKSTHWDPGPNFPMARYLDMVRRT